jgi:hypothetical protein
MVTLMNSLCGDDHSGSDLCLLRSDSGLLLSEATGAGLMATGSEDAAGSGAFGLFFSGLIDST